MRHPFSDWFIWTLYAFLLVGAGLPVYVRVLRGYAEQGVALSVGGHVMALGAAVLGAIGFVLVMMAVLALVAVASDCVRAARARQCKQPREQNHRSV